MWGAAALCGTPGAAEGLSTQLAARGCSPAGSLQPRWAQGNQEGLGEGGCSLHQQSCTWCEMWG